MCCMSQAIHVLIFKTFYAVLGDISNVPVLNILPYTLYWKCFKWLHYNHQDPGYPENLVVSRNFGLKGEQ